MNSNLVEIELEALFEISRTMGEALRLDSALERVLMVLAEKLAMKRATIILMDNKTGRLRIRASHGLSPEERKRGVYRLGEGITGGIFESGRPFFVPDIAKEPRFLNKTQSRSLDKEQVAFVGVPITAVSTPVGVLTVDRLFGAEVSAEEDIRFLTIVAQLIGQLVRINQEVKAREEILRRQNLQLKKEVSRKYNDFFIVGKSPPMQRVQQLLAKVAPAKASVLLLGESGTGKTLVARIIHELSRRAEGPFVKINCAALPESLLESELFGHEKGAFTGATESRAGRFEEADGGTVFLDEIAEMAPGLQAKLLRFLQDHEFERLGSGRTRKVDVRIIAATNQDLPVMVENGGFREDLYFRLNVFPIRIPPLRDRREDIPTLVDYFLDKNSADYGRRLFLDRDAARILASYPWPGNVREMANMMERLAIMCEDDRIRVGNLPEFLFREGRPKTQAKGEPPAKIWELEKDQVLKALKRNRWVQSRAASELGLTLRQMGHRIKKYGMADMVKSERKRLLGKV